MWTNWQKKVSPNATIPKRLLWDMDMTKFDFQKGKGIVAERVVERGDVEDFYTMFKVYGGVDNVREIYKNDVGHLSPRALAFICLAFNLKKEEMKCYIRRRSQAVPWNF
ncbi:MAG: hypothetical protein LBU22_13870 [Dysgonamonadaceae bacterium]|jgi:hypothetical protein|nr:hypothetical protein [Dysgonamonadaceae bacterium]